MEFPSFDQLPKVAGQPQGCLWGFFDCGGQKDEIGTLNLLTPDIVIQASSEIRTGQHFQLDWPLESGKSPAPWRKELEHKVHDLKQYGITGFDDEISFNTQNTSQWDSLKHYAHQKSEMFYNGLTAEAARGSTTNGIHNWVERGGIVGRGVLVDWLRWYEKKHGKAPEYAPRYAITVAELEETLKSQGTTTEPGDILIVRTGYIRFQNNASEEAKKTEHYNIGVENDETSVRWLYDHHFAAVAGDSISFESWPPNEGWALHEWLLVQWGTPIGELWDLEKLSVACEENQRWTFFLTSAPLNVKGGVGSPPNVIAIL